MTTQLMSNRDQRARDVMEAVIRDALQSPAPESIYFSAHDNHSGEPSLYVYITMPEERFIPDIEARNRLSGALLTALQSLDDDRFPYVYYGPREAFQQLGQIRVGE